VLNIVRGSRSFMSLDVPNYSVRCGSSGPAPRRIEGSKKKLFCDKMII
jgi:hypothetical protein